GVAVVQFLEERCNHCGVLPLIVVKEHVTSKVRIASKDFIGAFAGEDHLVTGIAYRTAQEVFGYSVCVKAEGLGFGDRIGKVICQVVLPNRNGEEMSACLGCHLPGDFSLVIFSTIEGQGKSPNRSAMVFRGQAEDRA